MNEIMKRAQSRSKWMKGSLETNGLPITRIMHFTEQTTLVASVYCQCQPDLLHFLLFMNLWNSRKGR